jgi:hypothetical protein
MASAEQYAKWIVDNQDKKGSPEFETVSSAYKLLRQGKEPEKSGFSVPTLNVQALGDTLKDVGSGVYGRDAIRSVGMGALDLATGAGQLVSNIAGAVSPDIPKRYGQAMKDMEAQYQSGRVNPSAPDVGRVTGGLIPSIAMGGGPAAATLPGRMAQGAKIGGVLGAVAPVDPDRNYTDVKATQVALSTALGGLAPPVVETVIRGAGAAINALGRTANSLRNPPSYQSVENTLRVELQRGGVDWNTLSQEVRNNLVSEVQGALRAGGSVNPQEAARLADFRRLGITPLSSQITRDPAQFARETNLSRMEVGDPIAERLGVQNQQLIGTLNAPVRGAAGTDPYSSGQRAIQGVQAFDAPRREAVTAAYDVARDHLGRAAPMNAKQFSDTANLALDDQMLGAYLPNEVRTILNRVSAGEIPFNVNTAVQIDRVLSAAQRSAGNGTPQSLAIGRVRDALNRADIADNVGVDAKQAFDTARGLAADRFRKIESSPAISEALEGAVAPEKFIEKFAIRGEVQDVANLLRNMQPQSRAEVRNGVLQWLRDKALSSDGTKFNQASFNRALNSIGERKLDLIFAGDRTALENLRALGRVGSNIQSPPIASGVNYSNSANALMDALDRAARLPVVGALMGKPGDIVRATQVQNSLVAPSPVTPGAPLLNQDLINRLAFPAGLLAAPVGVSGLLGSVK